MYDLLFQAQIDRDLSDVYDDPFVLFPQRTESWANVPALQLREKQSASKANAEGCPTRK